jgi:hypothetical protein
VSITAGRIAVIGIGVSLILGLPQTGAAQSPRHRLLVVFQNTARLPTSQVYRSQTEVSRLFQDIDIDIVWAAAAPATEPAALVLSVVKMEPSDHAVPPRVLGFTQSVAGARGARAYVFYRRVLRACQKFNADLDMLLAVAIAHELSHTLLPDGEHAVRGIMRAPWDADDVRAASDGRLRFSSESAALIRQGVKQVASR